MCGRLKAPCLDCGQRHIGCHAACETYTKFRLANEARIAKKNAEADQRSAWFSAVRLDWKKKRK